MARFFRYWLPFILYLAATFILSGLSAPRVPFNFDLNFLHYPEYAMFSFLLVRAIHGGKPGLPSAAAAFVTLILTGLWGFSDEVHQAFVPGRVPDISDLFNDLIGAGLGLAAFCLVRLLAMKLSNKTE